MKVSVKYLSVFATCSLGLAACSTSDDSEAMRAFENGKQIKGDDGSEAIALPQPELRASAPSAQEVLSNDWMLKIAPVKPSFVLGEPVVMRVTLENVSKETQRVAPLLQPDYNQTVYTVTRLSDGAVFPFAPTAQLLVLPVLMEKDFAPGETVTEEVKLFASKGGWMFATPGDYEVEVDFDGATSGANVMGTHQALVRVVAGSVEDQAAAQRLMTGEAPLLFQWEQGDHLTQGMAALREVTEQYPSSILAVYSHEVLGSAAAQTFFNGKERRPADPASAVPHLRAVQSALEAPNAPVMSAGFRLNTYRHLVTSLRALGQTAEADAVIASFMGRYGSDPTMTAALAEIKSLR